MAKKQAKGIPGRGLCMGRGRATQKGTAQSRPDAGQRDWTPDAWWKMAKDKAGNLFQVGIKKSFMQSP